jgi:hypothetical protein
MCQNANVRIRYPREIHIWGGFGSQLYGLALALDIREKYPRVSFKLVFHTSGVTERQLEIEPLLKNMGFDYDKKFDFVHQGRRREISSTKKRFTQLLKKSSIYLLQAFIIVARCNYRTEVRVWTAQIRGHYAYRNISKKTLENIANGLELSGDISITDFKSSRMTVHYRLGDLLSLSEKSEIEFERLLSTIKVQLKRNHLITQLVVLTDSIEACKTRFEPISLELERLGVETKIGSESSISTILCGVNAKCFVGTNSKISFWIVYFRSSLKNFTEERTSCIPIENINALNKVVINENTSHKISYY